MREPSLPILICIYAISLTMAVLCASLREGVEVLDGFWKENKDEDTDNEQTRIVQRGESRAKQR